MGPVLLSGLVVLALSRSVRAETDWSGPYVGVNGGVAWGQTSTSFDSDGDGDGIFASGAGILGEPPDGGINQILEGRIYGAYFGYNIPLWKHFLAGIEGAYNRGNILAISENYLPSANWPGESTTEKIHVDTLFSIAHQVSYAWGPVLFRTKGGFAGGHLVSELYSSITTQGGVAAVPGPTNFNRDQTHLGWTWGGGVDYALTDHWAAGVAFDYYDLGTMRFGGTSVPDSFWPISYQIHPILRVASARISYKFGFGGARADSAPSQWSQSPESVPFREPHGALILALSANDADTRAEAAVGLGDMRAFDAVEPLIDALRDKSIAVRGAAADALGKIGSRKALAPLSALLHDRNPKVRALAARALGALGDSGALPALRKAARDPDPTVRRNASAAIKSLGQP